MENGLPYACVFKGARKTTGNVVSTRLASLKDEHGLCETVG